MIVRSPCACIVCGMHRAHPLTMAAQVSPFLSCSSKFFQILRSTGAGLYSCRSYTCSKPDVVVNPLYT